MDAVAKYHCQMQPCQAASTKKPAQGRLFSGTTSIDGRGDRIRTCDLYVPNVALYQTELHPDSARRGGARMITAAPLQRNVEPGCAGTFW